MKLLMEACKVETQRGADALLARIIDRAMHENPELDPAQADYNCRNNIAYFAGDMPDEVRERVERLYRAVHPIFGSIRLNGPPTIDQAFKLGLEYGELSREGAVDARDRVAEMARIDERRVRADPMDTGINTRALGLDGKWGSYDISLLTCESLLRFLRSRGGRNQFAEATVLLMLGHELPESLGVQTDKLKTGGQP